ncbi:MAG: hypothetical protein E6Q95_05110 [Chitinophagaceae bacterium]|nr:MAG: hypothetical protein E6Q95_05110 [Chitinophagaceae bacterium]
MRKLTAYFIPFFIGMILNVSAYAQVNYDNMVSTFHSSLAKDVDGNFRIWGEKTMPNGTGSFLTPTIINTTSFPSLTGTPLMATAGSYGKNFIQHILLTSDDKLWAWGDNNAVIGSGGTAFNSISLPSGVTASKVAMLFATYQTLVITTKDSTVWVKTQNNDMRGDNGTGTGWAQVKKNSSTFLTGIVAVRGCPSALIALDKNGNLWTWGMKTWQAGGSSISNSYATSMTQPSGESGIEMIGATGSLGQATYYVLYNNGHLWAVGDNNSRQLGQFNTNYYSGWKQPLYSNVSTDVMNDIEWISPQEHDNTYYFINVIKSGTGELWNWGQESGSDLGRGQQAGYNNSSSLNPGAPTNFATGSNADIIKVESGGHTTMILRKCEKNFGYVGHRILGSMGNGSDAEAPENSFNFTTAPMQIAGAITTPTIRNDVSQTFCAGSTISLVGQPAGGSFAVVAGGTGTATINGNQITLQVPAP